MRIMLLSLLALMTVAMPLQAQQAEKKAKKVHTFTVTRDIDLPAAKVWAVVGEDYGAIAHSHPLIVSSDYINGSLKAEEGAERVCYFNEKGNRYLKEQILSYDAENNTLVNAVSQAGKFPVDPAYTQAIYKVEDLGNGKSRLSFDMQFRTKPGFMAMMAKGKFKRLINDYMIAVEHHARTGESVTKENFKEVKKQYES